MLNGTAAPQVTFNPVFIIALGGTGTTIAEHVRERLEWRYGDVANIPFVRFLFVDTDQNTNSYASGPDGIVINPEEGSVERMIANPKEYADIGLEDWIDMEALKLAAKNNFQAGASGVRMWGRLAFLAATSFENMWQQLAERLTKVAQVSESQVKQTLGLDAAVQVTIGPPRCYVVSSSCGGTGSAAFIDIGYILQAIAKIEGLEKVDRIGILAIAREDATSAVQYTRNTAAMLSELDYYNRGGVVYEAKFRKQEPVRTLTAPYDYCYLVSPSGPQTAIPLEAFLRRVGEYIYLDVMAKAQEAQARRADFVPDMAGFDLDGYPLRFLTMGVSSIEFPADVCHKACYHGTLCEFVLQWLHTDARQVDNVGVQPLEGTKRDVDSLAGELGVGAVRPQADNLLTELTKVPEDLQHVAGGMSPQDWMNEQIRQSLGGQMEPEAFADLGRKLDSAVAKGGYLDACVESNLRRLRNERWLEQKVQAAVLAHIFEPQPARDDATRNAMPRGPREALWLVQQLRERVEKEIARIDTELNAPQGATYTLEDLRAAIEAIRRDWLLRMPPAFGFPWINEHAVRREIQKPFALICEYYNRRAEAIILPAKKQLYRELVDPALTTLERRLTHLLEYLVAWHRESADQYRVTMDHPMDERTRMLFSEDVVQSKMKRVMEDLRTGSTTPFHLNLLNAERTAALREALHAPLDRDDSRPFTASKPEDAARGRGIDLRYVAPICEYVRERYRQKAAAGQPPIIYDENVITLFTNAAPTKGTGFDSEIKKLVTDSLELAQLNLTHEKYAGIVPINPRDGWWAFFRGARDPNQWTGFKASLDAAARAAAGAGGITAPDSQKWLQDIEDPYMVVLIRERAAYPTRIIKGYDIAERQKKIGAVGPDERERLTPFSRTGIRPDPPRESEIREAEQLFLGAILLGLFEYSAKTHEFTLALPQVAGQVRRVIDLPADFGLAVNELAYNAQTRQTLAQLVQDEINRRGKPAVQELLAAVKGRIVVDATGQAKTTEMNALGIRDLDDARGANVIAGFEAYYDLGPPSQGPLTTVHPYADWIPEPPLGRRPGYYCRGCQQFLGAQVDDIPPQCPNPRCGKAFIATTGQ